MGVYYRAGHVYGYKVSAGVLPDYDIHEEVAYDIAKEYGVESTIEGDMMSGTEFEVVFHDKESYMGQTAHMGDHEFGFFKIEVEETSPELRRLAKDYPDGEWGAYSFFTVY